MRSKTMLKTLLSDTSFNKEIKNFYSQHKNELLDIILFGSVMKGKEKPKDIDILLLFKEKENVDIAYALKKKITKHNLEITMKTYASLFSSAFKAREAFLLEGYSLIKKKHIAEELGFFTGVLYKYSLNGKTKSERMRFYYALYGRTEKDAGVVKQYDLVKFSDNVLFSPTANSEKVKAFLEQWNIQYREFPILMPERLRQVM